MTSFQLTLHVPDEREASVRKAMAGVDAAAPSHLKSAWSREGEEVFVVDVRRAVRVVREPTGTVEICWDRGVIRSGRRRSAVNELVLSLRDGSPFAVIGCAYRWMARHGLWLDFRERGLRGEALAAGHTRVPPRAAQPVALKPRMTPIEALQTILRECATHVLVNAGQVATGDYEAEHVHQLRVGLRRLRAAARLFRGMAPDPGLAAPAASWFKALGPARDRDTLVGSVGGALQRDGQACGLPVVAALTHGADVPPSPVQVTRAMGAQDLGLQLLAVACVPVAAPEGTAPPLARALRDRLHRWHRAAVARAASAASLDLPARHELRKTLKRLRYGLEFSASLFKRKHMNRYLERLREAQHALGELNDLALARESMARGAAAGRDAASWFALGWMAARQTPLQAHADAELAAFARLGRPCAPR